jgi:hypothetical protein
MQLTMRPAPQQPSSGSLSIHQNRYKKIPSLFVQARCLMKILANIVLCTILICKAEAL